MKKSTAMVPFDYSSYVERMKRALLLGLTNAAEVYRECMEAGGDPMALRDQMTMSRENWNILDQIVNNTLEPEILLLPARVIRALSKLPIQEQRRLLKEGVDLAAVDGSAIRRPLKQLTPWEKKVAFTAEGVRTIQEQIAFIKVIGPNTELEPLRPDPLPYEIVGKKGSRRLNIMLPVQLTVKDLARFMKMLEE